MPVHKNIWKKIPTFAHTAGEVMTNIQIYTKLSELPLNLKAEVADFIDFLRAKSKRKKNVTKKRIPGQAKGLITIKDNFDQPIEGFKDYI